MLHFYVVRGWALFCYTRCNKEEKELGSRRIESQKPDVKPCLLCRLSPTGATHWGCSGGIYRYCQGRNVGELFTGHL